jgi:methylated-DNA-[protein]-cysteine S-methyltransferase
MAGHFALFDTPLGRCAIAWTEGGIAGLQLPEADEAALRAVLARKHGGFIESKPTPSVKAAINGICALLSGERRALAEITLDMSGIPPFHRQVYEEARRILPGRTRTYGELAHTLGKPGAARAVGQALGANPFALIVPCHRVLAAGGRLNGFSAHGGIHTKQRLLEIEGALPRTADSLF